MIKHVLARTGPTAAHGVLHIDGEDISAGLRGFTIVGHVDHLTQVKVDLVSQRTDYDGPADVVVDADAERAMRALGWAPLAEHPLFSTARIRQANEILIATLQEVLQTFQHTGCPGYQARRSGWIREDRVREWNAILADAYRANNADAAPAP